jgi:hypothetical protein
MGCFKNICTSSNFPWLYIGDFNEVLRPDEHIGVGQWSNAQIQGFCDAVDICMLLDIGYRGHIWTFEKMVAGGTYTRVRLDQALSSVDWNTLFPTAHLNHLIAATSDHGPILLELSTENVVSLEQLFRYEVMWESHDSWSETIESRWQAAQAGSRLEEMRNKLENLSRDLSRWSRESFWLGLEGNKKPKARVRQAPQ